MWPANVIPGGEKHFIIGIVGFAGSGKNTVGDIMLQSLGYVKESYARSLKDAVSLIFEWPRDLLEGETEESRAFRETVDPNWSARLGYDVTPRSILQHVGTDCLRNHLHNDIWVHSLVNRIQKQENPTGYVITDARFPNEIDAIVNQGGVIIEVKRGPNPPWFDVAVEANAKLRAGHNTVVWGEKGVALGIPHISEWAWCGHPYIHYTLTNDGTIEDLKHSTTKLLDAIYDDVAFARGG